MAVHRAFALAPHASNCIGLVAGKLHAGSSSRRLVGVWFHPTTLCSVSPIIWIGRGRKKIVEILICYTFKYI